MFKSDSKRGWMKKSLRNVLWVALLLLIFAQFMTTNVNAQDLWPLENPFSPLASFPLLRGEAKFTANAPSLRSGYFHAKRPNKDLDKDLDKDYKMTGSGDFGDVFLDLMVRFQLGRFSTRTYFEKRMFSGTRLETDGYPAYATLDYWGWGLGGDVDIFLGNKSRVGFNIDQSFYGPKFTAYRPWGDPSEAPYELNGPWSTTIGVHAVYNPTWNIFGMSAIGEAWLRWPIYGTSVTDYKFSGGLKWPETVLGSFSLQGGYRSTSIDFSELYRGSVSATWGGAFAEISYYYH
jgi:hypothetical protein